MQQLALCEPFTHPICIANTGQFRQGGSVYTVISYRTLSSHHLPRKCKQVLKTLGYVSICILAQPLPYSYRTLCVELANVYLKCRNGRTLITTFLTFVLVKYDSVKLKMILCETYLYGLRHSHFTDIIPYSCRPILLKRYTVMKFRTAREQGKIGHWSSFCHQMAFSSHEGDFPQGD